MTIFKTITGQGDDVVVLHGAGCNHYHMQPIVDQLSNRYRVTNMDTPGAGQSAWQPSIKTIYDIVDLMMPELPQQATYIGWSFGGLVAMAIAAKHPERVKQIIGICTTPKFIASENWSGVPQPGFQALIPDVRQNGFRNFIETYYEAEFIDFKDKPKIYHELLALLDGKHSMDIDVFSKTTHIVDETDLRKEFASFSCPVDFILGAMDAAVTTEHAKLQALNARTNIHVISSARHMPFCTHPKEFNQILNDIL